MHTRALRNYDRSSGRPTTASRRIRPIFSWGLREHVVETEKANGQTTNDGYTKQTFANVLKFAFGVKLHRSGTGEHMLRELLF